MPNTTNSKHKKKIAPILCATVFILFWLIYLAFLFTPMIGASVGGFAAVSFLFFVGLIILAMIVGVFLALRQRLQEIEGGEEDEAKQY